jgi:hypothetical protein
LHWVLGRMITAVSLNSAPKNLPFPVGPDKSGR